MEIFLARQPIFDSRKQVFAYEILYRNSYVNQFPGTDEDKASANVIINTFQVVGLDVLTNNKPVFINFTENLLNQDFATIIPRDLLIVEVLESVAPTSRTVAMCKALKERGYMIALDDFVYKPEYEPLLKLADIIKVDFLQSSKAEIEALVNRLNRRNLILLAEKVETHELFAYAKQRGFSLFQGFFFSKPEIVTGKAILPLKTTYLQLMAELNQAELDFSEFSKTTSRDLALTYNLLRLVNSAAFGFRSKISSVKHALVLLGEKEIRKWISLMLLHDLGENKPSELVRLSLIRARFSELIAQRTKFKTRSDNLFLAGLFSLLDVILERPFDAVLHDIQIPDEVVDYLLGGNKEVGYIHQIIIAYEQGCWEEVIHYAALLDIDCRQLAVDYLAALQWYNEFIEPDAK